MKKTEIQNVVVTLASTLLAIANASSVGKRASIDARSIIEQAAVGTTQTVSKSRYDSADETT